ncbi:MAG: metallophosphoesterase [Nitrospirae bacterium]|uniref:metallophosphoesterase n=1 Tax=Candidatus Magnetobacterium casense TaxID=1455061 RepID=UPI00058F63D3|nr:metallophosphoesterase [Candidatus Magnetobacterium casensis]MBF0336850.1 metallophosphoesterase [Nitrospirota bacterium]
MKFAILSDIHLGDDQCVMVTKRHGNPVPGPKYDAFKTVVGTENDYLVLAGDIIDLSIAHYEDVYPYAKIFFEQIQRDRIAKEIIYLAGNHDADIWHTIQHQKSVIKRLERGLLPENFDHSVAGIIDDRASGGNTPFILDLKTKNPVLSNKHRGMFLDRITSPTPTVFQFAYPNLYIVTDKETVLVTHGHYLEAYWSVLGETMAKVAYDDLELGTVDIEEMVEMNYPLNQLACTGIGQAGILTKVVRQVEVDVKDGNIGRVDKYLSRLDNYIDELTGQGWLKGLVVNYVAGIVKDDLLDRLKDTEFTRYSDEFIYKQEVRQRFRRYYMSSLLEIGDINARLGLGIAAPERVIFGHTHQPIPWDDHNAPRIDAVYTPDSSAPSVITLHNTGGWLQRNGEFCGAEIFLYNSADGFSSVSIL